MVLLWSTNASHTVSKRYRETRRTHGTGSDKVKAVQQWVLANTDIYIKQAVSWDRKISKIIEHGLIVSKRGINRSRHGIVQNVFPIILRIEPLPEIISGVSHRRYIRLKGKLLDLA